MGGHGGLNILPQKRWNVYNFENREKVKRDEEEAAREEAIRQQKAKREETEFKLEKLRDAAKSKRRRIEPGPSSYQEDRDGAVVVRGSVPVERTEATTEQERPRHINLFVDLESRGKEGQGRLQGRENDGKNGNVEKNRRKDFQDHRDRQSEKKGGKPTGEPTDEHYRLGHGAFGKTGKKPWYMIKSFMVERTKGKKEGMSDTKHQVADSMEHQSSKSSKSKRSLEELRAERLAREQQERDRELRVLRARAGSSSNTGYTRRADGRVPLYHSSYGSRSLCGLRISVREKARTLLGIVAVVLKNQNSP